MISKEAISNDFKDIQDAICSSLEEIDGKAKFVEDQWEMHTGGGGGRSRVILRGDVFEKGGVNFSAVSGNLPPVIANELGIKDAEYFATGVSIVLHPYSPKIPIIHMNIRYFKVNDDIRWFGGGIDLTPVYIDKEETQFFHRSLKDTCEEYHSEFYPKFKKWADDYFYIKHRNETRGVGGIFFDKLKPDQDLPEAELFSFVKAVGNTFIPCYAPIVEKNKKLPFTPEEKEWQLIRRGRYVEFNLVYDRGTKFGLETSGRIESILMSLPEYASWKYNHQPEEGSAEAETLKLLKKGLSWT